MPFGAQLAEQSGEALLLGQPQPRRRFVQQQQPRPHAQRPGYLDHALLAERQIARASIEERAEPEPSSLDARVFQQCAFLGPIEPQHRAQQTRTSGQMRAECDVLEHAATSEQPHVLEAARDTQRRDAMRPQLRRWCTEQPHGTGTRRKHAADDVEQRCLAGTVWPDQRDDLVLAYRE